MIWTARLVDETSGMDGYCFLFTYKIPFHASFQRVYPRSVRHLITTMPSIRVMYMPPLYSPTRPRVKCNPRDEPLLSARFATFFVATTSFAPPKHLHKVAGILSTGPLQDFSSVQPQVNRLFAFVLDD